METSMLSVGIDIGTSTTSMVVSKLTVQNTASCFSVPRVAITGAEIIYRGEIYPTPQEQGERINAEAVANLLHTEYQRAGITPEQVQTGAVIITGESSRKENAALVTQRMSNLAGEFVVASAGPDLESLLAGKGAGAQRYSEEQGCSVLNLDIGGGTTNLALFRSGAPAGRGCWDVGGRLARIGDGKLTYLSPRMAAVADSLGVSLPMGGAADLEKLRAVTDRMARLLSEAAGLLPRTPLCDQIHTPGSSAYTAPPPDRVSFSGGVADYIYHPTEDWFRHGDIGPLLAESIRQSPLSSQIPTIPASETIRATVIGAGAFSTTVSGSTVELGGEALFPLKNLPAFVPGEGAEIAALTGDGQGLKQEAGWFLRESAGENLMFCLSRCPAPGYRQICALADALTTAAQALTAGKPLLVLAAQDYAKALGQALRRRITTRDVVCIDGVQAVQGDYLDLGRPILGGLAVPVVVKTLIFKK